MVQQEGSFFIDNFVNSQPIFIGIVMAPNGCVDTLWLYSSLIFIKSVYLASVYIHNCGEYMNALIPLNPHKKRSRILHLKSYKIKQDNHPQFRHLFLRVGGGVLGWLLVVVLLAPIRRGSLWICSVSCMLYGMVQKH